MSFLSRSAQIFRVPPCIAVKKKYRPSRVQFPDHERLELFQPGSICLVLRQDASVCQIEIPASFGSTTEVRMSFPSGDQRGLNGIPGSEVSFLDLLPSPSTR